MALFVVAYPKLSQKDFDWIQTYRQANDPRFYEIVAPHFTLVFAVSDISKESFSEEIASQAADASDFDVEIKVATVSRDESGAYYHEFLVPDVGYSDIVTLHDKLYSGLLADHLRLDLDFIPHIGIGKSDDPLESKARVDRLNTQGIAIEGRIDSLDIIDYDGGPVKTIEQLALRPAV